jgi:hypothetical protein
MMATTPVEEAAHVAPAARVGLAAACPAAVVAGMVADIDAC